MMALLDPAGPAVLLARSRQTPPLFVVVGCEVGCALIIKTWVESKLASPANMAAPRSRWDSSRVGGEAGRA